MKKIKVLLHFPIDILQAFITQIPGRIGLLIRYYFWKNRLKFLGEKAKIDVGVYFQNPEYITISDNCWIDRGVIILAGPDVSSRARSIKANNDFPLNRGEVFIGKNVHIGPFSLVSGIGGIFIGDNCGIAAGFKAFSFSHHYRSEENPSDRSYLFALGVAPEQQFMIEGPIFIDENVGIGVNAVILPGISIAKDSFVAINSVVSSSFGENSLIVGNPAKRIKERYRTTS